MRTLLIALAIILLLYILFIIWLYTAGKNSAVRAIGGFIPDCLILFKRILGDKSVSTRYKWPVALLVGYLALPIDIVPDFIPVAGQLDDVIIVGIVLRYIIKGIGANKIREHWPGPASSLNTIMKLAGAPRPN